jgi:4-hydroxybenzoate polyprenyltransferase
MLVKAVILLFLVTIIYSLGSALYYLARDRKNDEKRVVKALTWRIGLSLLLFFLLFVAFGLGWITPHSL